MSVSSEGALNEFLMDDSPNEKLAHLQNFVALCKDRSAIMAAGVVWNKELDDRDHVIDQEALIRTDIRCTKQTTLLDLSQCKN